jgi:transposase
MTGSFERIEVITGVARRRRWSVEEKLRIVAESLTGGASVSVVAQRHGLRPNQLFKWRKLARDGAFAACAGDARFVPVRVAAAGGPLGFPPPASAPRSSTAAGPAAVDEDRMEVVLPGGALVRLGPGFDAGALARLLAVLEAR